MESLIPSDHPLRRIRQRSDGALRKMQPQLESMYAKVGRPSVPPERLLRALLLQFLYGYGSERRLMTEMRYNLAFRWFVGLTLSEEPWDVTVFTKNRKRFLESDLAQQWLKAIVVEAQQEGFLDEEHFSVDGTLIQAWASERSYGPKADPPGVGQGTGRRGALLKRDLFEAKTDTDARIFRKSFQQMAAKLYRPSGQRKPQWTDRGERRHHRIQDGRAHRRDATDAASPAADRKTGQSSQNERRSGQGLSRAGFCGLNESVAD
jgi:transposase